MSQNLNSTASLVLRQYHLSGDVSTVPSQLPAAPQPFVGRAEEIQTLRRRMLAGPRLIFLTGPGGIGKTALAIHVVREMCRVGYFGDGVIWIDGREVLSYSGVLDEIARQLGLNAALGHSVEQRERHLLQQISDHDYVFVLDGLDTLAEGRRDVVQFVRALPGAVLITTRLHPPGLEVPERIEAMPINDGFQLLQLTSQRELPFEEVQPLLRRLEGSPLAIRLLAARLRDAAGINQLADEIIKAPTGRLHVGHFRGQTSGLLRTFLVAFASLDPAQQELLLAASCLRRAFTPALLAHMLGRPDPGVVQEALSELYGRGLIEQAAGGWRMHDILVEGLEARMLASSEARVWHQRAAEILSESSLEDKLAAAEHLRKAEDPRHAASLLIMHSDEMIADGLEGPLAEQMSTFFPEQLGRELWLRLSEVQGDVARTRQQWWEANHYYERALAQLKGTSANDNRRSTAARLCRKQAEVALDESNPDGEQAAIKKAELWLERATRVVSPQTPVELVRVALLKSRLHERLGQMEEAVEKAEQALTLARRFEVEQQFIACYRRVAELYRQREQNQAALAAYESAVAVAITQDNKRQRAELMTAVAEVHRDLGNWIEAIEAYEDSLPYWRETSLGESLASALVRLGSLLIRQGYYSQAQRHLQDAQVIARRVSLHTLALTIQGLLAEATLRQGDYQVADVMLHEGLRDAQRHMAIKPLAILLRLRAEAAEQAGKKEEAERLRHEALVWARRSNDPYEQHRVQALAALVSEDVPLIEKTLAQLPEPKMIYEKARLRLRLAELLAQRDRERANRLFTEGAETFDRLGVRPETARIAQLRHWLSR